MTAAHYEVFFEQPNYFLAIFSQVFYQFSAATANSGTRLNSQFSCVRSLLYGLGVNPQKIPLPLLLCVDSLLQRHVYCSCIATSVAWTHREHCLQHLFYCCVTCSFYVYGPRPSNSCFSTSTVLALSKYATVYSQLAVLMKGKMYN
jgi:hypothetical protein